MNYRKNKNVETLLWNNRFHIVSKMFKIKKIKILHQIKIIFRILVSYKNLHDKLMN